MAIGMRALDRSDRSSPIDRALLVHHVQPAIRSLIRLGYFSWDVEGLEHVPRDGRAVFVSNHAGWFALDAFFLGLAVAEAAGPWRTPHFATADAALAAPLLGPALRRIGAVPASWLRRPERLPEDVRSCGIFPEGVQGNCKPFWHAYRMRGWKRGFARVARALGAPVVPVAVLGGEECLPVAWTVRLLEPVLGSIVGLPLSWIPLPVRWKIVFHAPVAVAPGRDGAHAEAVRDGELAAALRGVVQDTIDRHSGRYPLARLSSAVAALAR
jgi:1-acyl-sn-glycerol-3-phosphate acyltransferase